MPRSFSRCRHWRSLCSWTLPVLQDISRAACGDRRKRLPPLLQSLPFICDYITTDLDARRRQRATPRRDLARLGEIEHGLCDVLSVPEICPRVTVCAGTPWDLFCAAGIHDAWSYHVHANCPAARIPSRDSGISRPIPPLVNHWDGCSESRKRMIDDGSRDAHHTATALLREHLALPPIASYR